MIDIVTVVFGEELAIMSCQAQSLDLYCQDLGIQRIFIMVNEPHLQHSIDPAWYGSLASKVQVVPRHQFPVAWSDDGWLNQQLLKILGSTMSTNDWSMVLDAKTVLTKSLDPDQLMTPKKQMRLGWLASPDVFRTAQNIANDIFACKNYCILEPGGVPFFFHNAAVRSMIDFVTTKTNKDFGSWFLDQGMLTEFVLYSTWISSDVARAELYHTNGQTPSLDICHVCHRVSSQFDQILDGHTDQSHILSVHRRVWANLSADQRKRFRDKLIQRGITRAEFLI